MQYFIFGCFLTAFLIFIIFFVNYFKAYECIDCGYKQTKSSFWRKDVNGRGETLKCPKCSSVDVYKEREAEEIKQQRMYDFYLERSKYEKYG